MSAFAPVSTTPITEELISELDDWRRLLEGLRETHGALEAPDLAGRIFDSPTATQIALARDALTFKALDAVYAGPDLTPRGELRRAS